MKPVHVIRTVFVVVCVIFTGLVGCDGCSCGRGEKKQLAGAAATPEKVPATATADLNARPGNAPDALAALTGVAALIPAGARWVAVFDPIRVRDTLHKVAQVAPKLTRARDYKDIQARLLDLYGIDTAGLKGPCILAGLPDGGRFLVCGGIESIVPPVDASRWIVGDHSGYVVLRRESRVSFGTVDGRFVAGGENAVYSAVQHYVGRQPSLGALFARRNGIYRELAAEDAWGGAALFFPGRMDPGWCPPEECSGTAIFSGKDRFLAVSIANGVDGTAGVRQLMEQAWRDKVLVPWQAALADPRIPPEYLRDADRSIQENGMRVRADRVIFEAGGDFLDLLSVIYVDDIDWLLGK